MKKLILLGLTVIFFIACQNKAPERYTTTSPEIDVVKTLIKDYHDGNWESWMTHYADTAKIYHNTWKNDITPGDHATFLKDVIANLSSYHFDDGGVGLIYEMVIDNEENTLVHFWGNWKGTLAANNREIEFPVHLAFMFVDNKIVAEGGFYNLAEIMEALNEIEAAKMDDETE